MKQPTNLGSEQKGKYAKKECSSRRNPKCRIKVLPLELESLDERYAKPLLHKNLHERDINSCYGCQPEYLWS
jgi:hypothetical protein